MRLRSSDGWKEKSNPASVLMVDSLAIRSAIFTRRFSRSVSSSANKVSMTSSALASPRSSWRTVWSKTSRALGIFKPTRVLRMRSSTDGTISIVAFMAGLPDRPGAGQRLGRSRVGAQRRRHRCAGHDRFVTTWIGDPRHFPMTRGDPALMAALQRGMRGNQGAVFKDPNLIGECVYFDDPLPGRVGNAPRFDRTGSVAR